MNSTFLDRQLRKDVRQVCLDGLLTDAQFLGDLVVADTLRNAGQDLPLAPCQVRLTPRLRRRPGRLALEEVEDFSRQARVDPDSPGRNRLDGIRHGFQAGALQDVPVGSAQRGARRDLGAGEARQHNHLHVGMLLAHLLDQPREVRHPRHLVVQQHHVRMHTIHQVAQLLAVGRFRHDLDIPSAGQGDSEHLTKHGVVICHEHPDHHPNW